MRRYQSLVLVGFLLTYTVGKTQDAVIRINPEHHTGVDSVRYTFGLMNIALQFENSTGGKVDLYNGFKVSSPDGYVWSPIEIYSGQSNMFNLEFSTWYISNDGQFADTVGIIARGDSSNPYMQLPNGWNSPTVNLSYFAWGGGDSLHLCVDTCSFDPVGSWRWISNSTTPVQSFSPEFIGLPGQVYQDGVGPARLGSGYCFLILTPPQTTTSLRNEPTEPIHFLPCDPVAFTFEGFDPEGDPVYLELISGPGFIDSVSGLWQWTEVNSDAVGPHTITIRPYQHDPIFGKLPGIPSTIAVVIDSVPALKLTSGCNTDILLTGDVAEVQMGTSNGFCDDNIWFMTQINGPISGVTCSLSTEGLIYFSATTPGYYGYQLVVLNGMSSDFCEHSFIVHGGPGCCVLQRGNVDGVAGVDLSDLSRMIAYMYSAVTILPCWDEANVNGSGIIDLTDLSILISFLIVPGSVTLANCP